MSCPGQLKRPVFCTHQKSRRADRKGEGGSTLASSILKPPENGSVSADLSIDLANPLHSHFLKAMKGNLDHHFRRHHHQHHHVHHVPKNPQVPVGLKAVKGEKDTGDESSFAWNERDGEEGHR